MRQIRFILQTKQPKLDIETTIDVAWFKRDSDAKRIEIDGDAGRVLTGFLAQHPDEPEFHVADGDTILLGCLILENSSAGCTIRYLNTFPHSVP